MCTRNISIHDGQILDKCDGAIDIADNMTVHCKNDSDTINAYISLCIACDYISVLKPGKDVTKATSVTFFRCVYVVQRVYPEPCFILLSLGLDFESYFKLLNLLLL